jgi:hypothetical protein
LVGGSHHRGADRPRTARRTVSAGQAQYDPATQTLEAREGAKAAELAASGREGVSARTIRRRRKAYEARGLEGLVDHRNDRARSPVGRTDERVVGALRRAIEEAVDQSSRTATFLMWKTEQILAEEFGPGTVAMPSRSTFFRVFKQLSQGHRQLAEVVWQYGHGWIGGRSVWPGSGRRGGAGDLVPGGESAGHFASVFLGAESVAAGSEVWGYPAEGGQEPLGVPG